MAYLIINNRDYSAYCNGLKVNKKANYNAQTNAAGNTVVDYINSKREIEVSIIHINDSVMKMLQEDLAAFDVNITIRNPATNALQQIRCIIPDTSADYYTIQTDKVLYKETKLKFIEL